MKHLRFIPVIAALIACVSCGGGGGSSSTPSIKQGVATQVPFSVTVKTGAGIQSIGITSPLAPTAAEQDIATTGAGCTAQGLYSVCSATLSLPSGAQTLGVAIHAATTTHTSLHTVLSSSRVALAVGTTIAQVSVDLATSQLSGGVAGTATVYVTARDANGNAIVGTYGGTVTLASSDPSVTLSPSSVTQSGTSVTASYSGSTTVAPTVTVSATVSGLAASAIVNAVLSFTSSQTLFVSGGALGAQILQFPLSATGDVAPMRRTVVTGASSLSSISPDGAGNLTFCYTPSPAVEVTLPGGSMLYGDQIARIPVPTADGSVVPQIISLPLPAGTIVNDCATDGNGNSYALYIGQSTGVMVVPAGSSTPSRTITGTATGLISNLTGPGEVCMAVGPDGTVVVAGAGTAAQLSVFAPGANGNVAPVRTITGAATTMSSWTATTGIMPVALGPDGSIYVLDSSGIIGNSVVGTQRVLVFAPGANGNVAPSNIIAGSLTELSQPTGNSLAPSSGREVLGLAVDAASNIYVTSYASEPSIQIVRFNAGATGNVAPSSFLGGPLAQIFGYLIRISSSVIAPAAATAPSISGDFLAYSPNRGWNYSVVPSGTYSSTPQPPVTATLYADPNPAGSNVQFALLETPGAQSDATSGTVAADATFNNSSGYIATAASSGSNGFTFTLPLPGGITLLPPSLTLGQTWVPYAGLTATVTNIGTVPGSSACPTPATGATVTYSFGDSSEIISYVPGCGITDLITDNGAEARLQSIGSYPQLGTLSVHRASLAEEAMRALSQTWKSIFTPWRPSR